MNIIPLIHNGAGTTHFFVTFQSVNYGKASSSRNDLIWGKMRVMCPVIQHWKISEHLPDVTRPIKGAALRCWNCWSVVLRGWQFVGCGSGWTLYLALFFMAHVHYLSDRCSRRLLCSTSLGWNWFVVSCSFFWCPRLWLVHSHQQAHLFSYVLTMRCF